MTGSLFTRSLVAAWLVLPAVPALADDASNTIHGMGGSTLPMPTTQAVPMSQGTQSPADTAMMSGMQKMQHDMAAAPMTGEPDHDFVTMMLPHHQGAVDMAKVELRYGKDPELRKLAEDIIAAQDKEIAQMQAWLMKHPGK